MDTNAANSLAGRTLASGWTVVAQVSKPPGATGGFFSVCYTVRKDGKEAFLKAYNFAAFFQLGQSQKKQVVDIVSEMLAAYKYERDLSAMCKSNRVTKVSFVKDAGEEIVDGFAITVVPYLIFDVADGGDIRQQLSFSTKLETSWKLRSLHSVAVGLNQLHALDVSHQDLKPSNVLLFNDESKIGDLGRSTSLRLSSPLHNEPFTGDWSYAPPEILYGAIESDWKKRTFSIDCYLFGSLIVFYFTGHSMTALLRKHLHNSVSWEYHTGSYQQVEAFVQDAFAKALDEFELCLDPLIRTELRELVTNLCHPLPGRRSFGTAAGNVHDKQRLISRLDRLSKRVDIALRKQP